MLRDTLSMVSLQFSMRCLLPFAWLPPKIRASRQDGLCVGTVLNGRESCSSGRHYRIFPSLFVKLYLQHALLSK